MLGRGGDWVARPYHGPTSRPYAPEKDRSIAPVDREPYHGPAYRGFDYGRRGTMNRNRRRSPRV